jgi:predicted HicB family RNase H-like nuclease
MKEDTSGKFTLKIDREFRELIDTAARKSDRSTGAFIRHVVREQLRQRDQDYVDRE